ncbi:hypothetical protein BOSP111201_22465 [Bordetella sputigena]|uniref:hypothetical protein n=1 Tax=Bordetella sputigena TaxID=1416810 RepID=UPI0039F02E5E
MQVSQPSVPSMDVAIDLSNVTSRDHGGQVSRYPEGVEEATARIVEEMANWTPARRAAEEVAQIAANLKFLSEHGAIKA